MLQSLRVLVEGVGSPPVCESVNAGFSLGRDELGSHWTSLSP